MNRKIKSIGKYLLGFLPRARPFDFLHSLIFFIYAQRRLPRRGSGLFNDYLFFLKTGPEMTDALRQITSDKVYAKFFIDQIVGRKVTPETYAVFDSVDDIRRSDLPDRCVLKPAHACGVVLFLEDAGAELSEADRECLRRALDLDFYREFREANYRNLRKRVICEQLIECRETIKDYKLLCYKGVVKLVIICHHWHSRHKIRRQNFYDSQWDPIPVIQNGHPHGEWEPVPRDFSSMREIAEKIAQHFELVRVDLYRRGDKIYVGELTHCHNQAHGRFETIEQEKAFSRILFG